VGAAVGAGTLAQSPCRRVSLPTVEREEMRFLTPAEVATLADAIHQRYRALVLVGAYGWLRIGELAGCAAAGSTCSVGASRWARSSWSSEACCTSGRPRRGPAAARWGSPGSWPRSWSPTWPTQATRRALHSPLRRVVRCRCTAFGLGVATGDQGSRVGWAAHPRPSAHGGGLVDRGRCQPQGGLGAGRACLGELHGGPLRPPLPGGRRRTPRPLGRALRHHPAEDGRRCRLAQEPDGSWILSYDITA